VEGQFFRTCPKGQRLLSTGDREMPLRANCAILAGQLGSTYYGFTVAIRRTYTVHRMVFNCLAEVFKGDLYSFDTQDGRKKEVEPS
jgi:hypothetical protein